MAFSIFVSHTEVDVKLAEAVTEGIRLLFGDHITLYLAAVRLRAGERWKEKLRENLLASESIISIITPESVAKPWLYAEWGHFWLQEKPYFVLLSGAVPRNRMADAMLDSQVVDLESESSIRGFLHLLCDHASLPVREPDLRHHAARICAAVAAGRLADRSRLVQQYVDGSTPPPEDEREMRDILDVLYSKGEIDGYRRFFRRLRNDGIKADMALRVCRSGDVELASLLCEDIQAADHLCRVAEGLIEAGHGDAPGPRRVLERVGEKNAAELRKLAVEVLDRGDGDTDLFQFMAASIRNMAELRKVAVRLVERGEHARPVFAEITGRITRANPTALRDVALEFVRQGTHRAPGCERLMDALVAQKPSVAVPVLEALREADPEMLPPLHRRHAHLGPDNAAVEWLTREMGVEWVE